MPMFNKKISIIVLVLVITAGSTIYSINELASPTITIVSGSSQYIDYTFEEKFEKAGIVVEGKIIDIQIATFREESVETDMSGNEIVFETRIVPRTEVTIEVTQIFKDNYGIDPDYVSVYDRNVENAIGQINGEKARFVSQNAIDYNTDSKGIFFIENDRGLWIDGFTSFYEITEGKDTIETEFDKKYGRDSIDLADARKIAKLKSKEMQENYLDSGSQVQQ